MLHTKLKRDIIFLDIMPFTWRRPLIDEVNDARLLTLASERMAKADSATFVPAEHLYEELGITQDALDAVDEVDIE